MAEQTVAKRPRGRPRTGSGDPQGGTVQALDRGLTLLAVLAKDGKGTLSDLAMRVGMPPSSVYRLLTTLQGHGLVDFDEAAQEWMVGIEAFRIGSAFAHRTNVIDAAREAMRGLMHDTGETANLAIADDGDVVFMSQVETHNPIRAFFRPGTRGFMHASGIGKALLSELSREDVERILQKKGLPEFTAATLTTPAELFEDLDNSRERGWAFDDEERYDGMRCVAAPIFNAHGEAIAGISVSGPTVRFPDQSVSELGIRVRNAAADVTRLVGGTSPLR